MVKKGDIITREGFPYNETFVCVCADKEVFVLGKAKFKKVYKEEQVDYLEHPLCSFGYEVCGYSSENLRAFPNTEESLSKNYMTIDSNCKI